jgi:hypothetical protein
MGLAQPLVKTRSIDLVYDRRPASARFSLALITEQMRNIRLPLWPAPQLADDLRRLPGKDAGDKKQERPAWAVAAQQTEEGIIHWARLIASETPITGRDTELRIEVAWCSGASGCYGRAPPVADGLCVLPSGLAPLG